MRKMYLIILAGFTAGIFCFNRAYAQDKNIPTEYYNASTIPDSLKQDADVVVRYDDVELKIKGAGRATYSNHRLVTILNEKGKNAAILQALYVKKRNTINTFSMRAYDAAGKLIKKYSKGDAYDGSATDETTIISDDRFLGIRHNIGSYPITIETEVDETLSSFIAPPTWLIQHPETSVQFARCKIWVDPAAGFRYKPSNFDQKPEKTTDGSWDTYTWQAKNLKVVKPEEDSMPWQYLPRIYFAVNSFEFYDLSGDISSWKNYGKWIQTLNADVNTLPAARAEEIRKMTDSIKTDKEKVRFLYRYLQQNMRYVSIQLGIGGLKPFPATFVDQKKYGDCKALSNYMCALLKAVNIPAYYAIVNAGANEEPADPNFPSDPFNHIIVCVPLKSDTTWLECTSNTSEFGKLGAFTENRNALLVTEDGAKLVNTPKSSAEDNQFNSEVHLKLDPSGQGKAEIKILSSGGYRDMFVDEIPTLKADEQREYLLRYLNIKQPESFNYQPEDDIKGFKQVKLNMEFDQFYDMAAGDKQFYKPRVFDLWTATVPVAEKRKTTYFFRHPMRKTCVTTIDLPQGFTIDALPTNVSLKFTYGNYEATYKYDEAKNQVIAITKFNLTNQAIPANKYTEMQQYFDDIARAQNKKMVIKRKAV